MSLQEAPTGYKPIESYGLIGNCMSAALVGLDGSIDWCCFPRFDSPSVFAAILDAKKGGRFAITPTARYAATHRYVGDTNVLETTFATDAGECSVTDLMPLYRDASGEMTQLHQIIRVVRGLSGSVSLDIEFSPQPDYARYSVSLTKDGNRIVCQSHETSLALETPIELSVANDQSFGRLNLVKGQEVVFVLTYSDAATRPYESPLSPIECLDRTVAFWEFKAADLEYEGPWEEDVRRAYLALHLLTYEPTGAIVAAPTTSLPEGIGGVRNWDYRYTWLRDAAFTIDALVSLGHPDEALSFFKWLHLVCIKFQQEFQIMYRIDSEPDLPEQELPHFEGYKGSRPVRIGNGAYRQLQHDIYGEVLSSAYLLAQTGQPFTNDQWELLKTLANQAKAHWQEPDSGIWEVRGGPYHFVYSKVMCWVALDRAVKLAEMMEKTDPDIEVWRHTAEEIKQQVLSRGWSESRQAFVQHYDTSAMDASNLLIPLVGFLPFDDPRVVSTVERVEEELGQGPFLKRYLVEETDDGLVGEEGAFTLCSFWLVRVLARMGRIQEAIDRFNNLLTYGNHLRLFSEMVDPESNAALGNFPQAFTHIGLILAARECGLDEDCE